MQATALKSIRLEAASASGKKFYEITISEAPGHLPAVYPPTNWYTVEFSYGAVGGSIKTGTKTPVPVAIDRAEAIFAKLRKEKENGESHYREVGTAEVETVPGGFQITQTIDPLTGEPWADGEGPPRNEAVLPPCINPRLLNDADHGQILNLTKLDNWWVQLKHDGDRVQLHVVDGKFTFYSGRSAKLRALPKPIADAIAASGIQNVVFDGELVEQTLWVFDLLRTDGDSTDWLALPYQARYECLESIVSSIENSYGNVGNTAIMMVGTAKTAADKEALIISAKENAAEGVVFINKNAPYRSGRPNRGGDNLRWKFVESGFFIVHEHRPDGKESISVRLNGATEPIGTCSVIGKELPPVGAVVEARYLYCQSSLVQARLLRARPDIPHYFCRRNQIKFKDGKDPQKGVK